MTRTRRMTCTAIVALALGLEAGCSKQAPEGARSEASSATPEVAASAKDVTVVGRNYCLGCALKKAEGAAAQCSKYGHRHALDVESAVDAGGEPLALWRGRTLHYLENEQAAPLATGDAFHGKRVEVQGRLFPASATLEVRGVREP